MHRNRPLILLTLSMLIVGGCGGGGPTGRISFCNLDSFLPNYARQVRHLLTWPAFPVRVHFVPDAHLTAARQTQTLAGFDQWVTATDGVLRYQINASGAEADIVVRFNPTTANGLARITYGGLTLRRVEIEIGVRNLAPEDIQCIAAHEFGHALGIDGHSDDPDDLMYAVHFVGTPCPVSQADLNTLKTGYCSLFSDRLSMPAAPSSGPLRTITLHYPCDRREKTGR